MNNFFERTSSYWVKYNEYEYKKGKDDILYLTPTSNAKPIVYDPLKDGQSLVLDAVNVGIFTMQRPSEEQIKQKLLDFVSKYGLLGFMTALPTTPQFMDYEFVYLPKNHFIKDEYMTTQNFLTYFFPFNMPDFTKDKKTSRWNVSDDKDMMALMMTFVDDSMAMAMSLQRDYAERYDWLITKFRDLAFNFVTCTFYYKDSDKLDEETLNSYRKALSAFSGIAPTYHIALYDKPTIVWDFHSLLLGLQMMFSFMLTDSERPLRLCKHCSMAFLTTHPKAEFCGESCKNKFNVYKNRKK